MSELPTVLVADDEPVIVHLLQRMLEKDFRVVEAADGVAALASWHAERPAAVVLDQMMPGMTGLAVAEQILADDPAVPVVLFSAAVDRPLLAEATRLGVAACLSKSEVRTLRDVLVRLLSGSA